MGCIFVNPVVVEPVAVRAPHSVQDVQYRKLLDSVIASRKIDRVQHFLSDNLALEFQTACEAGIFVLGHLVKLLPVEVYVLVFCRSCNLKAWTVQCERQAVAVIFPCDGQIAGLNFPELAVHIGGCCEIPVSDIVLDKGISSAFEVVDSASCRHSDGIAGFVGQSEAYEMQVLSFGAYVCYFNKVGIHMHAFRSCRRLLALAAAKKRKN